MECHQDRRSELAAVFGSPGWPRLPWHAELTEIVVRHSRSPGYDLPVVADRA